MILLRWNGDILLCNSCKYSYFNSGTHKCTVKKLIYTYIKMVSSFGYNLILIQTELCSTGIIFILLNHYRNMLTTFLKRNQQNWKWDRQGQHRSERLIHNGNGKEEKKMTYHHPTCSQTFFCCQHHSLLEKRGLTVITLQPEVMLHMLGTSFTSTGPSDMYIFVICYDLWPMK
jgi:hypothetical protein